VETSVSKELDVDMIAFVIEDQGYLIIKKNFVDFVLVFHFGFFVNCRQVFSFGHVETRIIVLDSQDIVVYG
jgi:hypothetical protein